jgi:aminoglycoside phosphotransferase (APT) family kinase protein
MTTARLLEAIDPGAIQRYLAAHGFMTGAGLRCELISGGKSNLTFSVRGNEEWILRRPPLGDILPGAHDVTREYRFLTALHGTTVAVPRPVHLCTDPSVLGAPFYVMEAVPGRVYRRREEVAALTPTQRHELGTALVDQMIALHQIDPATVGLSDVGRPRDYLSRQLARWTRQYDSIRVRDLPEVDPLSRALQQAVPELTTAAIVHGDYRLDNVIVDGDAPEAIRAVLDWEMATVGDPLADLATLLMFWDEAGHPPNPISAGLTAFPGFPCRREVIARYLAQCDLEVADLDWYLAFAHFRLAVILEQIYARHLAGHARGAGFEDVAEMVPTLLTTAMDFVSKVRGRR